MVERIPELIARLDGLKQGQIDSREYIKSEIMDLKNEHIADIRKNICRLWLRVDDLRETKNLATGAMYMLKIYWSVLGLIVGILGTFLFKHSYP